MTGNDRDHRESRRKSSSADSKMAAQSQGIKQLMAAEKEAAQVVASARKSKLEKARVKVCFKSKVYVHFFEILLVSYFCILEAGSCDGSGTASGVLSSCLVLYKANDSNTLYGKVSGSLCLNGKAELARHKRGGAKVGAVIVLYCFGPTLRKSVSRRFNEAFRFILGPVVPFSIPL